MRIVAFITQTSVIDQILTHLRTRAAHATHAGARSPPSTRAPASRSTARAPRPPADARSPLLARQRTRAYTPASPIELPIEMERMLASKEPYVLDVIVPFAEHVLPMIPAGKTVKDIIIK